MTVSTHKSTAQGSGSFKDDGGTILNGGNISGSKFQAKTPIEIVQGRKVSGSKVVAKSGDAYNAGITTANSSGTLAFNPSGRSVTRSATDTGFLIRGGVANNISGISSLNPILSGASDTTSRRGGNIHPMKKYRQNGTWATAIFDIFGGGLLQSDGTAKDGITDRGTAITLGVDHAAEPVGGVRAIPGEFVILFDFATFTNNYKDYSAFTGA